MPRIRKVVDQAEQFDDGTLPESDKAAFFQELIDTGLLREFPARYQAAAKDLIARGQCKT